MEDRSTHKLQAAVGVVILVIGFAIESPWWCAFGGSIFGCGASPYLYDFADYTWALLTRTK